MSSDKVRKIKVTHCVTLIPVLCCVGCYNVASYEGKASAVHQQDENIQVSYRDTCEPGSDTNWDLVLVGPVVKPVLCAKNAFNDNTHVAGGALGVLASAVPFTGSCTPCTDPHDRQQRIGEAASLARVPDLSLFASDWFSNHPGGDYDAAEQAFFAQTKSNYQDSATKISDATSGASNVSLIINNQSIPESHDALSTEFALLAKQAATAAWPEEEKQIRTLVLKKQQDDFEALKEKLERDAKAAAVQKAKDDALKGASDPEKFATAREAMEKNDYDLAAKALDYMSPASKTDAQNGPLWLMLRARCYEAQGKSMQALEEYREYNRLLPGHPDILQKIGELEYNVQKGF